MKEVAELLCDRIILRNILKSNTPEVQSETKDIASVSSSPISSKLPKLSASSTPIQPTTSKSSLIDEDDSWVDKFEIPTTFSARAMDSISTGIISQSCRTEIVQTLAAHMWVHTHYPSKSAYNTICSKLVKVYPTLADDAGDDQVAHLSWKQKLRDRFKFLRRPPSGTLPPHKRRRTCASDVPEDDNDGSNYDDEEFEKDIKDIRLEMLKKKKNSGELCQLMMKTFSRRQKWIQSETPPVRDILSKYPALKHAKVFKQEFRSILNINGTLVSLLDNWELWKERIIRYARVESQHRKNVLELLESYDSPNSNNTEGEIGIICLKLLCELFIPRNRESGTIIHSYSDTIDIEEEVLHTPKNFPYLVVLESTEKLTYLTVVERENLISTENFKSSLLYLIGAYYSFNIQYPKLAYPVLIFLQRYVLGIEDTQTIPKSVRQAVTVMNKFI